MRKLYLFLTLLLATTCIIALMAASAGLYERYEANSRLAALKGRGQEIPATVVDRRAIEPAPSGFGHTGRIDVELQSGPRRGEVLSEAVPPHLLQAISVGEPVTALVGPEGMHILELHSRRSDATEIFLAVTLLSLAGTVLLMRRIRRMPA